MKISIITVTKNNKTGLIRAIECVRSQTYKNIEHIIVDGGSTDGTVEILRSAQNDSKSNVILNGMKDLHSTMDSSLAAQNDFKNSSLLTNHYSLISMSEADSGIYDAINKGIKLATGDVIGLLHSDDLYADVNVISRYAEVFERPFDFAQGNRKEIDAVYSDLVYVKKVNSGQRIVNGKKTNHDSQLTNDYSSLTTNYSIIRYWKTHKAVSSKQSSVKSENIDHYSPITDHLLLNGWMPPHPTLFIRKEIYVKFGSYRTDMKIASDYDMILRLLYKHKITSYYLPVTTYLMTIGGASNKSPGNIIQKSKEDFRAMKLNGIPFPLFTLLIKNLRKLPQFLARD